MSTILIVRAASEILGNVLRDRVIACVILGVAVPLYV